MKRGLRYNDLEKVNKIVLDQFMLQQIYMFFVINQENLFIEYNFKKLNIEILSNIKISIFFEKEKEDFFSVIFFANEKKILSFTIQYILDIFFDVTNICEYEGISKYNENAEQLIFFVLEWFQMIIFYMCAHEIDMQSNSEKLMFFINTT